MPIQVLSPDVAQKIAAGEVVERPASVVKELVENALDAGARSLQIEIRQGGLGLIRVVDDGSGIPSAEVALAFVRHATSKIKDANDLAAITTLGFRGEALASIAAVAQVTLQTQTADADRGAALTIEGGVIVEEKPYIGPVGTAVLVRNLFFNVPARLKFLRSTSGEAGQIGRLVEQLALARPDVRFRFVNEGRRVIETPGSGEILDTLRALDGNAVADRLIPVSGESTPAHLRVTGYVSEPNTTRATRGDISFFVNRRWVRSPSLTFAVEDAYYPTLQPGRHPIATIHLELPPADVDVNVHPAKSDVRMVHDRLVFATVQQAIRSALLLVAPLPTVGAPLASVAWNEPPTWPASAGISTPPLQPTLDAILPSQRGETMPPVPGQAIAPEPNAVSNQETAAVGDPVGFRPTALRAIGQVQNTYIVAEGAGGIYFIDQHTAHERILYEEILAQRTARPAASQALLTPVPVVLDPVQRQTLAEHQSALEHVGFAFEEFGPDAYVLRAVPVTLGRARLDQAFCDALDALAGDAVGPDGSDRLAATLACHSAVRAGDSLTPAEIERLLWKLEQTDVARYCPHGRPVVIHLPVAQLERDFHRR